LLCCCSSGKDSITADKAPARRLDGDVIVGLAAALLDGLAPFVDTIPKLASVFWADTAGSESLVCTGEGKVETLCVSPKAVDSSNLGLGPDRILPRCAGVHLPSVSTLVPAIDPTICAVIAVTILSAMSTLAGRDDVLL